MRHAGQFIDALKMFDRAIAIDPLMVAAWYGRAQTQEMSGDLADASQSFQRVCDISPGTAPGFAGLACVQARLANMVGATANAARAAAIAPDAFGTILARVRCDLAAGNYREAVKWLRRLETRTGLAAEDRITALGLLGDALDGLGDIEPAYDSYARANALFLKSHEMPNSGHSIRSVIVDVERTLASLATPDKPNNGEPRHPHAAAHVFLLGFPRSGNTLVEQILATVPGVQTTEEAPTIGPSHWAYFSEIGISDFWRLDDAELERLRTAYWEVAARHGVTRGKGTYVDMDPFKGAALPLIARLFPEARIVVLKRDPRDIVWSCFRRNFAYSPATCELASLTRAAHYFAAVMRLIERSAEVFDLHIHTLHYEDLVSNFDTTTQRLCGFLGLPWAEEMRNFPVTAQGRSVRTASAQQVCKALFDGSGQWRRYAGHLEPIMPILEPWIDR